MNFNRTRANKGFSLVELLAVVLILAVLAAVAVPLYINTRKISAARACKANINAVASAESAFALRNGVYTNITQLTTTGPESLSAEPKCPLDNTAYTGIQVADIPNYVAAVPGTPATGGTKGAITITCPNAATHSEELDPGNPTGTIAPVTDWQRPMSAIVTEGTP